MLYHILYSQVRIDNITGYTGLFRRQSKVHEHTRLPDIHFQHHDPFAGKRYDSAQVDIKERFTLTRQAGGHQVNMMFFGRHYKFKIGPYQPEQLTDGRPAFFLHHQGIIHITVDQLAQHRHAGHIGDIRKILYLIIEIILSVYQQRRKHQGAEYGYQVHHPFLRLYGNG